MKRMIPIALILAAILCHSTALQADTTITYQGRLDSGGQPHTGTVDMVFQLYDQASGGSQQGPTLNESVQVTDGLFQSELDFGAQPYEAGRWLQITVNGQHLSPRQHITAVPFAIRALTPSFEEMRVGLGFSDWGLNVDDGSVRTFGNALVVRKPLAGDGFINGSVTFPSAADGRDLALIALEICHEASSNAELVGIQVWMVAGSGGFAVPLDVAINATSPGCEYLELEDPAVIEAGTHPTVVLYVSWHTNNAQFLVRPSSLYLQATDLLPPLSPRAMEVPPPGTPNTAP